jgi:hypothetical protein
MKKSIADNINKQTPKDYLYPLLDHAHYLKMINPVGKPYQKVYEWLLENCRGLEDNDRLPTMKKISESLKMDSNKFGSHLKSIYNEIKTLNENEPQRFAEKDQLLCFISFKYYDKYAGFSLGFNTLPRVHDTISFPFIRPLLNGCNYFHVYRISHDLVNTNHEITILVTNEFPNSYFQLLKDKSSLTKSLSFHELHHDPDFVLQDKLLKMHRTL